MGGVAGEAVGTTGCGDRNAAGQSWTSGDGGADWIFCEHAGAAGGRIGPAEGRGGAGEGEEAGDRGAAASGHTVRAGGGLGAAGAESGAQSVVPGDVYLAGRGRRQIRAAGVGDRNAAGGTARSVEIRPDTVPKGCRGAN